MRALVIIAVPFVVVAAGIVGMFWLIGATTPDQSHLSEQVKVTMLDATEETRPSSPRYGHRVQYFYDFGGATYVDDRFVPLQTWQPGLPLRILGCIDPDSPSKHALALNPPLGERCDGTYVGTEQTATPRQRGE